MKHLISTVLIASLLLSGFSPVFATNIEAPPAPTAPSSPVQHPVPPVPTAPAPPAHPFESTPTPTPKPPKPTPAPEPTATPSPAAIQPVATPTPSVSPSVTPPAPVAAGPTPPANVTGGQTQLGGTGDNSITTGDANNSSLVISEANTNFSSADPVVGTGPGIQIINSGNGSESQNQTSVAISQTNQTYQINDATTINYLHQQSISGDNSVAYNTGGDSSVTTGNANVSATAITSLNTNTAGLLVSEFNIFDDHRGDYILNFAANCVSGCPASPVAATNAGNGSGSVNNSTISHHFADLTFQSNDATVGNNLTLVADSGNNSTSFNTNGNSSITTGDANVSANVLTFANNNLEGNVVYAVVNIYGNLLGDIIFPEEALACCGSSLSAANTGNGSNSTNQASAVSHVNDLTVQTNKAIIENNLTLNSQTGANDSVGNTGGSSQITTGNSNATAQVLNIANTNISGDAWLVLVNNAGSWTGQIIGANGNFAASLGMMFTLTPSGEIMVTNSANGTDSASHASAATDTASTLHQTNTALIQNNLDLTANTGNNKASFNTGGDSKITTGDANIIANLVNFVNNNITGGGKLFVTVINVFGSWVGNLLTPGQRQPPANPTPVLAELNPVGGAEVTLPVPTPASSGSQSLLAAVATPPPPAPSQAISVPPLRTRSPNPVLGSATETHPHSPAQLGSLATSPHSSPKPIRINLAWLLLLLPIIAIILVARAVRRRAAI